VLSSKNFASSVQEYFCASVKFVDVKCRSYLNRVFMSWTAEFDRNSSLFLLTKKISENIY